MPEPFNKKISLDNFIYTSFKEMKVPKICMLNPNLITIFNLLVATTIGYVFYNNKSIYLLIFLSFINRFLDIFDGLVARKCNKTSKIGKYLDTLGDIYFFSLIIVLFYYKISKKESPFGMFIVILTIYFIFSFTISMTDINKFKSLRSKGITDKPTNLQKILHDNSIIFGPLFVIFVYLISNKFSK